MLSVWYELKEYSVHYSSVSTIIHKFIIKLNLSLFLADIKLT